MRFDIASRLKWWRRGLVARTRRTSGIVAEEVSGNPPLVVSLTTIPDRLQSLHVVVDSLLSQTVPPQTVRLWISRKHVSDPQRLPGRLSRLQRFGLVIGWVDETSSHRKLICPLRTFGRATIVTADDDVYYDRTWLQGLLETHREHPNAVVAHVTRMIQSTPSGGFLPYVDWPLQRPEAQTPGHRVLPVGVGGVLYPPGSMDPRVMDYDMALRLAPTTDDLWFKTMALLTGTPAVQSSALEWGENLPLSDDAPSLWSINEQSGGNDQQWRALVDTFSIAPVFQT